jgi:hypothetical protein
VAKPKQAPVKHPRITHISTSDSVEMAAYPYPVFEDWSALSLEEGMARINGLLHAATEQLLHHPYDSHNRGILESIVLDVIRQLPAPWCNSDVHVSDDLRTDAIRIDVLCHGAVITQQFG